MKTKRLKLIATSLLLFPLLVGGCKSARDRVENGTNEANNTTASKPDEEGMIHSGTGAEKERPAPGKANVQGKVFYNDKPAAGIEVKLCGASQPGCSGETFTAKTDNNGEYLINGVSPGIYESLRPEVFWPDLGYLDYGRGKYGFGILLQLESDQTFFAPDTHLFKADLKLLNPKQVRSSHATTLKLNGRAILTLPTTSLVSTRTHPPFPRGSYILTLPTPRLLSTQTARRMPRPSMTTSTSGLMAHPTFWRNRFQKGRTLLR